MGSGRFWGVKVLLWGLGGFCGFSEFMVQGGFCGFGEFDGFGVVFVGLVSFCGVGVRRVVGNGRIFQPEPATQ